MEQKEELKKQRSIQDFILSKDSSAQASLIKKIARRFTSWDSTTCVFEYKAEDQSLHYQGNLEYMLYQANKRPFLWKSDLNSAKLIEMQQNTIEFTRMKQFYDDLHSGNAVHCGLVGRGRYPHTMIIHGITDTDCCDQAEKLYDSLWFFQK